MIGEQLRAFFAYWSIIHLQISLQIPFAICLTALVFPGRLHIIFWLSVTPHSPLLRHARGSLFSATMSKTHVKKGVRSFEIRALVHSGVLSRGAKPVPPVVRIKRR